MCSETIVIAFLSPDFLDNLIAGGSALDQICC
jgi:hypothetical protein